MISANEFILFYNELFKNLDKNFGKKKVEKLWDGIKNTYCKQIDNIVKEKGLKGMYDYWSKTLGEEGGRYHLTLNENEFIIDMHCCPSVVKLSGTHVRPYKDYCGHCPALYKEIIEKNGFVVNYYIINRVKGECRMHVCQEN
jgi:hypothetical protein